MSCLPDLLASPPPSPPTISSRAKASPTKATQPAAAQYHWMMNCIQNRRRQPSMPGGARRSDHLLRTWGYRMSRIPDDRQCNLLLVCQRAQYLWMKYIQNRRRQP
ncbi:hypothetical protein PBRA_007338 [Plasmodiophora brassicae]|uniref:Uncharacterized protein n=1 Tax=Plasmodiophora brassicae TaxID=37360 RepID=A0A0G4IWF7_PLABS|nr:hypothetical protein PBRA_007338 [Plasmodiophora brassicae]